MKMTVEQYKKISNIYHDYISIETEKDLRKRKMSLSDYDAFRDCFNEIQRNGKTETFISALADYFKKFGFTVTRRTVNYCITF